MLGSAPIIRARLRSGGRSRRRATPTPQFNLGQAYRLGRGVPTNLAAATPGSSAPQPGACRCRDHARPAAVPERRPGGGPEMAQEGRRPGRAARAAGLRHRARQRRQRHSGPGARLCLCQPRGRAGTRAGEADARRNSTSCCRSPTASAAWRSRASSPKPRRRRRPRRRSRSKPAKAAREAAAAAKPRQDRRAADSAGESAEPAPAATLRRRRATGGSSLALSRSAATPKRSTRSCRASPRLPAASPSMLPPAQSPASRSGRSRASPPPQAACNALGVACFPVPGEIVSP